MSFSKAKLKRFNDITALMSPFTETKDKDKDKDYKKSKKEEKFLFGSMDAESIKPQKSALRLFRTPSLPRRLKFRHISDLTPKKMSSSVTPSISSSTSSAINSASKEKDEKKEKESEIKIDKENKKNNLPPIVQLYNKIDVNKEALQNARFDNDELKNRIQELNVKVRMLQMEKNELLEEKDNEILALKSQIKSMIESENFLQKIANSSLGKIMELEGEMKVFHKNYEQQINMLLDSKTDMETKIDNIETESIAMLNNNENLKTHNSVLQNEKNELKITTAIIQEELDNKNIDIKHLEKQLDELVKESQDLKDQVKYLKQQSEDDMMHYVEESRKTICSFDKLNNEKSILLAQLNDRDILIQDLKEELNEKFIEIDLHKDEITNNENLANINLTMKKYENQIATMKELNDMKIKELESIHTLEKNKQFKEHSDEINILEKNKIVEIERINELAEEKIRLADIQADERIKAIEISIQKSISNAITEEKITWQKELAICQQIAETEIMQSEFEKHDLKSLWAASTDLIRERESEIKELKLQIRDLHQQCARINTEKYNYQLTLNTTRSTVNILMDRLRKSDEDVEKFKEELNTEMMYKDKIELENVKMKRELEDFKGALLNLRNSSINLEKELYENNHFIEKLLSSEDETIHAVTHIANFFNSKMDETLSEYMKKYNEMKYKFESRELYIKDMKTLLDEFATGIELARLEIDDKEKRLIKLENENKEIKLEHMTYKFKCEQFEKYNKTDALTKVTLVSDNENVSTLMDQKFLGATNTDNLKNEVIETQKDISLHENNVLRERLIELEKKLQTVEKYAHDTSEKYNSLLQNQTPQPPNIHNLKEANNQLKNKITKLQDINKKQENAIHGLQEQIHNIESPHKLKLFGSPKTPKGLISPYVGKENNSPLISSPKINVLRTRNN